MGRLCLLLLLLSGCGPSAVYLQGGQGSTATLDVSAMTGAGKVVITGPFVYCAERIVSDEAQAPPTGGLCAGLKASVKP